MTKEKLLIERALKIKNLSLKIAKIYADIKSDKISVIIGMAAIAFLTEDIAKLNSGVMSIKNCDSDIFIEGIRVEKI